MKQNKIKVLSDKEHILLKPEMYIGGMEEVVVTILVVGDKECTTKK